MAHLGEFERAEEMSKKGTAFAHELGHLLSIGYAEVLYGLVMGNRGRGEQAIQHFEKAVESFEKSQGLLYLPQSLAGLGYGYYIIGDVPKALEYSEKGLRMLIAGGIPWHLSWFHWCVSVEYLELEDLTKALFHAKEGVSTAQKYNLRLYEGMCLIQLGMVQWKNKKIKMAEAEECIRKGISILKELEYKPWEAWGYLRLGELFADASEREKALENLKRAEQMCDRMGMDLWPARTRKALARIESSI
jgi:tetratricopeptide (TPR) repeat protein